MELEVIIIEVLSRHESLEAEIQLDSGWLLISFHESPFWDPNRRSNPKVNSFMCPNQKIVRVVPESSAYLDSQWRVENIDQEKEDVPEL